MGEIQREKIKRYFKKYKFHLIILTSINDPHRVGNSLRHVFLQPLPQFVVHFLCLKYHTGNRHIMMGHVKRLEKYSVVSNIYLLWGGSLASANGPHRLISEHDLAPVLYIVCERHV